MKRPEIGDRLWYWPGTGGRSLGVSGGKQPLAAVVAHVIRDNLINVAYFDARGVGWSAQEIPLWDGSSPKAPSMLRPWCEWPHETTPAADKHSGD